MVVITIAIAITIVIAHAIAIAIAIVIVIAIATGIGIGDGVVNANGAHFRCYLSIICRRRYSAAKPTSIVCRVRVGRRKEFLPRLVC